MAGKPAPRVALDMYVLAQGVKTGVYRVCDELFTRLARSPRLDVRLFYRNGDDAKAASYVAERQLTAPRFQAAEGAPSSDADILLSPFGVAPTHWLLDHQLLHAHFIYDLIAINRPDFFSAEAAAEVQNIVDSLDEDTVIFAISEFTKKDLLAARPDLIRGRSPSSLSQPAHLFIRARTRARSPQFAPSTAFLLTSPMY